MATAYVHPRPALAEANKLTYPEGLKNFLAMSSPSPPGSGVSPTYDLLHSPASSDADRADAAERTASKLQPQSPARKGKLGTDQEEEHHHAVWRQINRVHDELIAQRAKEKGDPGAWRSSLPAFCNGCRWEGWGR